MVHRRPIPKPRSLRKIEKQSDAAKRRRSRARERMRERFNRGADRREAASDRAIERRNRAERRLGPRIRRIVPDPPVNKFFRGYPQIQLATRRRRGGRDTVRGGLS